MSYTHEIYRPETKLTHHIPSPVSAVVGVVLGLFGMVTGAVKLVMPHAVITLDVAYQILMFAGAICATMINLYYLRELKRAQTAKAIADLSKLSDDEIQSYKPPRGRGGNMRDGQDK